MTQETRPLTGFKADAVCIRIFLSVLCSVVLILSACTPVPLDQDKPVSYAKTPPPPNTLRRAASASPGFAALSDGNEALGARLRLIEAAEHSLDLQYFLMKPDLAGALVIEALFQAADRGVRVRFLLDDVFTTADDTTLALLNAHPNVQMRIFNPAMRPGPKWFGFVSEFNRVNRRMHNKSFTADGSYAIIGGRNIADEYYQIDTTSEFADFEMLIAGPTVKNIAATFDLFWNDGRAVPMERLRDPPSSAQLAEARAELTGYLKPARATYERAVNDPYFDRLGTGQEPRYTGAAAVVTDTPEKLKLPLPEGERILAENFLNRMKSAKRDVILLTPYFVPEDWGARFFVDLAARGVRVRVVTNSLASTNHAYVHAGYRRHRARLLEAGVELYEIRADALQVLGLVPPDDTTGVVMHTKLAVIDGRDVFVGSLNFDPRSIKQNTELGLFIQSPRLAGDMLAALNAGIDDYTYRLSLASDGSLRWHYDNPDAPETTTREPGATFGRNLIVGITALLGVELQL